jgi:hypothetical protein
MKKAIMFSVFFVLVISNIIPVFADKVLTDVTIKERITVPGCPPTQQAPLLLHEQQDQDGNKIKIYCSQGRYLMQYVTSTGTTYYVGGCFFDSGQNVIYKLVHYDKYTIFSNGTKKGENATFTRTWWYNFNAPQLPARTASNASDYEFEFDPATEILIKYNTVHNGTWETSKSYRIINVTQISNKTITNPDDPQKLVSYASPSAGEMSTIPADYVFTTPLPVTGYDNGTLSTVVFTQFLNNTLDITPISAKESSPFVFYVDLPGREISTLRYSLSQAPDGMTIDPKNGTISWTPGQEQAGDYNISVKVQDAVGFTTYQFTLPVEPLEGPAASGNYNFAILIAIVVSIIVVIVVFLKISKKF